MKNSIAPKIYSTNLQAFVEKAFRASHGRKLSSTQQYLPFVVSYLDQFRRGDLARLLVNLPGRHLKTFLCSICLPAFMLGKDPTLRFLITAHNEELAEDIVRQIREIMQSSWYRDVFPTRIDARHSTKNDFTVVGGGRVRAAPISSVTGKGGDVIIFDDPHNVNDWDNDGKKIKVIEAFEFLVSRKDRGKLSRMLVVGHRVAEDDLSAHILERDDFEHVCLPLFAPKNMCLKNGAITLQLAKGEALQPEEYDAGEIERRRRHHRGSPFRLYYLQGLGPKKDSFLIEASHFPFVSWTRSGHLASGGHVVLSVDPALKTESVSRNVIHVYAVYGDEYVLVQAFAEKCSFSRLKRKIKHFSEFYSASVIIVENTARGPDLIDDLRKETLLRIIPVNPVGNKYDRLRQCLPVIQAHRIHLRQNKPNVEEAIDEVLAYPNCVYDDNVDAMTNFLIAVPKFTADMFVSARPSQQVFGAVVTSRTLMPHSPTVQGLAMVRAPSIFGPTSLPDFSNGRPQPDRRPDGSSHYAAKESSEPIYSFDGEKMVRLKIG